MGFEPINMNSVLATLRQSLLAINHFLRLSKSEFTAASKSIIEFVEAVRRISEKKNWLTPKVVPRGGSRIFQT